MSILPIENNHTSIEHNESLFIRLKFFIYDLLKFNSERLNLLSCKHPEYYFSRFYFTEDEIEELINFHISSDMTYKDLFDEFIKTKSDSVEICTSHDIAPFIYNTFNISKRFIKDPRFIKQYKKFKGLSVVS